uniref:Uncharacterized protein n=1 Tax=Anguilla anguilla TaxID=7936 RepID=A0A0E9T4W3_ANGAN
MSYKTVWCSNIKYVSFKIFFYVY